jgi:hypothetical protein
VLHDDFERRWSFSLERTRMAGPYVGTGTRSFSSGLKMALQLACWSGGVLSLLMKMRRGRS